jgi:hypothetical protein
MLFGYGFLALMFCKSYLGFRQTQSSAPDYANASLIGDERDSPVREFGGLSRAVLRVP